MVRTTGELGTMRQFLVTASVVRNSSILFTLMMEALPSSETSFLQATHGVTSQKTAMFFKHVYITGICKLNVWDHRDYIQMWLRFLMNLLCFHQ
jgi:hypothetical protein